MDLSFQVDLRGVVDLLSHHLYSSPRVYLRELLQNAVDATTARLATEPDGPDFSELLSPYGIKVLPYTLANDKAYIRVNHQPSDRVDMATVSFSSHFACPRAT